MSKTCSGTSRVPFFTFSRVCDVVLHVWYLIDDCYRFSGLAHGGFKMMRKYNLYEDGLWLDHLFPRLSSNLPNAPPSDRCAPSCVHRAADAVEVKAEREFTAG